MPAKRYDELPVSDWNTRHFAHYLAEEHRKHYGIDYVPFRGYQAEAGILARYIGTAKKPGAYDKDVVKAFIDACFAEYKPNAQYPGLSFGFMTTYMNRNLQRAQAEKVAREKSEASVQASDNDRDLETWF